MNIYTHLYLQLEYFVTRLYSFKSSITILEAVMIIKTDDQMN